MSLIKYFFIFILVACSTFSAFSQTTKPPAKNGTFTPVAKFKPPVVKTYLGKNSDTAYVSKEEASQLVKLPLKITDKENNTYSVSSYQFLYKQKSVIENDTTGKKQVVFTLVADIFKKTPLPELWKNNISGSLQKDEELFFFDIIVRDKLKRRFFAPAIKIIVQ